MAGESKSKLSSKLFVGMAKTWDPLLMSSLFIWFINVSVLKDFYNFLR